MRSLVWTLSQYDWCSYKKRKLRHRHTLKEDHVKIQGCSSTSQGERLQKKLTLLTPWSHTSSHQNFEKINFCCLSHPNCGPSLLVAYWWLISEFLPKNGIQFRRAFPHKFMPLLPMTGYCDSTSPGLVFPVGTTFWIQFFILDQFQFY